MSCSHTLAYDRNECISCGKVRSHFWGRHSFLGLFVFLVIYIHINNMFGKYKCYKMLKNKLESNVVQLLLMFKVGGVNSPQFQFLTHFVCDQNIDIDILFCYVHKTSFDYVFINDC